MNPLSVINAIVTNLGCASALGANRVGKDYSVIESSQFPTAVVGWLGTTSVPTAMGGGRDKLWTFSVEVFIKDTGSASAVMDYFPTLSKSILDSLESDLTLQGTVDEVNQIRCSRELGESYIIGTAPLYPFLVELDVYEI